MNGIGLESSKHDSPKFRITLRHGRDVLRWAGIGPASRRKFSPMTKNFIFPKNIYIKEGYYVLVMCGCTDC